jgi:hypothetical protein
VVTLLNRDVLLGNTPFASFGQAKAMADRGAMSEARAMLEALLKERPRGRGRTSDRLPQEGSQRVACR